MDCPPTWARLEAVVWRRAARHTVEVEDSQGFGSFLLLSLRPPHKALTPAPAQAHNRDGVGGRRRGFGRRRRFGSRPTCPSERRHQRSFFPPFLLAFFPCFFPFFLPSFFSSMFLTFFLSLTPTYLSADDPETSAGRCQGPRRRDGVRHHPPSPGAHHTNLIRPLSCVR